MTDQNGSELLRSAHRGGSTAQTQSVEIGGNPLAHMTGYKDEKNGVKLNVTFKQVLEQEGRKNSDNNKICRDAAALTFKMSDRKYIFQQSGWRDCY